MSVVNLQYIRFVDALSWVRRAWEWWVMLSHWCWHSLTDASLPIKSWVGMTSWLFYTLHFWILPPLAGVVDSFLLPESVPWVLCGYTPRQLNCDGHLSIPCLFMIAPAFHLSLCIVQGRLFHSTCHVYLWPLRHFWPLANNLDEYTVLLLTLTLLPLCWALPTTTSIGF